MFRNIFCNVQPNVSYKKNVYCLSKNEGDFQILNRYILILLGPIFS